MTSALVEEITRYQFFLQVTQDVLQGRLPVTIDLAVELAALALQSELQVFDRISNRVHSFSSTSLEAGLLAGWVERGSRL